MVKLILLLVILGALAAFALQNLAPVSLVFLGIKTLALPLAIWVIAAIGAGACTTLLIAGLLQLARPVRSSRPTARTASQPRSGFGDNFQNAGWTRSSNPSATASTTGRSTASSAQSYTNRSNRDDWETGGREEWDDWDEIPKPIDPPVTGPTEIRDREDEAWEDWEVYERSARRRTEEPVDRPRKTDFEAPQNPTTRTQSGSVYSYGYGRSEDEPDQTRPPRQQNVYDAEYRVITPPYRPEPEDAVPEPPKRDANDDDWDFDEDWETDRPRNP